MIQRFSPLTLTILVFAFACSKQGEGQRCDYVLNGNNDCEVGLECASPKSNNVCDSKQDQIGKNCLPYLCCPPRPAHSNVEACNQYEYGVVSTTTGGSSAGGGSGIETGGSSAVETGGSSSGGSATGTGGSDTGGTSGASTEPDAGTA